MTTNERPTAPQWTHAVRANLALIRARRLVLVVVVVVFLVAALGVDHFWPHTYSSTAHVATEPQTIRVPPFDSAGGAVFVNQIEYMQTQIETVTSDSVLSKVAQDEHLEDRVKDLSTPLDVVQAAIEDVEIAIGLKQSNLPPDKRQLGRAIGLLAARTKSSVVKDSFILEIQVTTRDTKLSKRLTEKIVAAYPEAASQSKLRQLSSAEKVLGKELADQRTRVDHAVAKISGFDEANAGALTTSTTTTDTTGTTSRSTGTTANSPKQVERQQLQWTLDTERKRYEHMQSDLDVATEADAAIRGQVNLSGILQAPQLASRPDGIDLKFRILLYLLMAPILGIAACYVLHYMDVYRRAAPRSARGDAASR